MNEIISRLIGLGKGPTVEDLFFDRYIQEQKRKALQSVYTASSRPIKPGVYSK